MTREGKHHRGQQQTNQFLSCAELILTWLTARELATVSSTCKQLHHISKSITAARSSDASRSIETFQIPFINAVDSHPYAYFLYAPSQILLPSSPRQLWGPINPNSDPDSLRPRFLASSPWRISMVAEAMGCDCVSKCSGNVAGHGCRCFRMRSCDVITECGPSCRCFESECGNRVTQRGLSVKLTIARDRNKGWGLHADQYIQLGQFVCEYAGELLTTEEARMRQLKYDELASAGQFSSALLVVREHLPSGKACFRINIDATRIGNVARFINHSCGGGNLSTVLVRSSGALLPRVCFFASKNIKAGEELSFNYGDIRLKSDGLKCFCGDSGCYGTLPSENT
ncbi:hypothetical protein Dimus_015767 [Dionaea muscipula]